MKQRTIVLLTISLLLSCLAVNAASTGITNTSSTSFIGLTPSAMTIDLQNQQPNPATSGDLLTVNIAVTNGGADPLPDQVMDIVPSYPFSLAPGQVAEQDIGALQGYAGLQNENERVLQYQILVDRSATAGTYDLEVYVHPPGSTNEVEQKIPIEVTSKQDAEVIHIDRTAIIPGQVTNLSFYVDNVGGAPLDDLTFSWSEPNNVILPVGSDNTQYIKEIDVGQSALVTYQVIADTNAVPGLYKLELSLTYLDPINGQQNISTNAGLYVGGPTEFTVAPSDSGTASTQTSFSVANTGSNPATAVSVIIPTQREWAVSGSNSVIIGNLNKGDYTVASFTLVSAAGGNRTSNRTRAGGAGGSYGGAAADTANGSPNPTGDGYPGAGIASNDTSGNAMNPNMILVEIDYSDTTGTRQVDDQWVNVATLNSVTGGAARGARAGGATAAQNPLVTYKWYLIGLVVLVVGGAYYYNYRRKKLVDPNFKVKNMVSKKS